MIGAGPTGCAAALSLAQAGAEVILISDGRHGVGEHVPAACAPLLQQLSMEPEGIPCTGIVSALQPEQTPWHWEAIQHPLGGGWLVDRANFGKSLRQAVRERGLRLIEPARLLGLEPGWRLQLDQGEVRCDFVVDASGRRGVVARRLGIPRHRYCRQRALVGWLRGPADDADATLCVEGMGIDWGYTCRIAAGRRVAAVLGPAELEWKTGDLIGGRLQGYTLEGPPRILPADATLLEAVSGPGWLALGDAAATSNPLAGHGLFNALQAGLAAARLVGATAAVLADYQEEVRERFHRLLIG